MNEFVLTVTGVSIALAVIVYAWTAWSLSAVFGKAGQPRWQAWVPVLNLVVLLRLGGISAWFVLVALVPGLGQLALWVLWIMAAHRITRAFGLGTGMTVLAALVPPVWSSVLGWGSARWLGEPAQDAPGPLRVGRAAPVEIVAPADAAASADSPTALFAPAPIAPAPTPPAPIPSASIPPASIPPASIPPVPPVPPVPPAPGVPLADAPRPAARTSPPQPGSPVPISSVPGAASAPAAGWAAPAAHHPAQAPAPEPVPEPEWPLDDAIEVSAIAGAPTLGAPRSASSAISAQHALAQIPDEDVFDVTVMAVRKRSTWSLVPPLGEPVLITADVVIIGRRPAFDADFASAQLVPVADETRTVSKTHARLERRGDDWVVIDLDSTNGVILIDEAGDEIDATPGVPERLTERFLLGDAPLRIRREAP